jgi:hypothetical protein
MNTQTFSLADAVWNDCFYENISAMIFVLFYIQKMKTMASTFERQSVTIKAQTDADENQRSQYWFNDFKANNNLTIPQDLYLMS